MNRFICLPPFKKETRIVCISLLLSLMLASCAKVDNFNQTPLDDDPASDTSRPDASAPNIEPDVDESDSEDPEPIIDPDADDDLDGILNGVDQCFVSPVDEFIDANGCSLSQLDSDDDGIKDDTDSCDSTPSGEMIDIRGCGVTTESDVVGSGFIEEAGLLVIELESTDYPAGWHLETGSFALGNAYLVWQGGDKFSQPGNGLIEIPIQINNPGTYRFDWRTLITEGDNPTEANDSWLTINSNSFYGSKISTGNVVCPKGKPVTNVCVGDDPEGASKGGWLKVYRSGGPVDDWKWNAGTNDNDKHSVYAQFNAEGNYVLKVSGRSNWHGVDRLTLYRQLNAEDNISADLATSITTNESARID
jgi:hypothetical protein